MANEGDDDYYSPSVTERPIQCTSKKSHEEEKRDKIRMRKRLHKINLSLPLLFGYVFFTKLFKYLIVDYAFDFGEYIYT
jgi:hypothetical protein